MKAIITSLGFLIFAASLSANTYVYSPLKKIPKGAEILVFTNGPRPGTGTRKRMKKEDIARYLDSGVAMRDPQKWTYPKSWSDADRSDGVFFDKDGIAYFWRILMPGVLILETERGESARLEISSEKKNGAF